MILALEEELKNRLGITVKGRPPRKPDKHREFLDQMVGELKSMPDGNMMITMEFSTMQNNAHIVSFWRGGARLGSAPADISAQSVVNWLHRISPE